MDFFSICDFNFLIIFILILVVILVPTIGNNAREESACSVKLAE